MHWIMTYPSIQAVLFAFPYAAGALDTAERNC